MYTSRKAFSCIWNKLPFPEAERLSVQDPGASIYIRRYREYQR